MRTPPRGSLSRVRIGLITALGEELPDKPTPEEIRKSQKQWRDWYLTIYPGYTFLDGF